MVAFVNQEEVTQTVKAEVSTSKLKNYRSKDVDYSPCGPLIYTLWPSNESFLPFLSLDEDTLILRSTDPSEITASPIDVTISASLDYYPEIEAATQTFQVWIQGDYLKPRFIARAAWDRYKLLEDE